MNKDYSELKKEALALINKEDNKINVAIHLYIITENIINGTFKNFDDKQIHNAEVLVGEAASFYEIMTNKLAKQIEKGFDLWVFVETAVTTILRKMRINEDDSVMREVTANAMACTFQIWKTNVRVDEILNYFKEEKTSLPCAYNRQKVYAWAVDNGIACSETQGLTDYAMFLKENMTAEEEIFAYQIMDSMCKAFDNGKEVFINQGMREEFINEHHKLCRHLFMGAVSWYHFQPLMVTFDDLHDDTDEAVDKKYQLFYDYLETIEFDGFDDLIFFDKDKFFAEHPDAVVDGDDYKNAEDQADDASNQVFILWFTTINICNQMEPMGGFLGMKRGELINHAIKHSAK